MKVTVTEEAWRNMLSIGRWIGEHNPARAETFLEELHERCESLGYTPYAFALLSGHEQEGIRKRVFGEYLIFYRVAKGEVEILHVLHGATDYQRILFPEGD